ncbi:MAG: primosomal protein N' [Legionellales bacterium]|nr:MAG: primosomal protein N' [Legionellales bacterium]
MLTNILQVAVPLPLRKLFDYLSLEHAQVLPGQRVLVSFGRKILVGIVVNIRDNTLVAKSKLKSISKILDPQPIFSKKNLELLLWASNYYHSPIGEVLHSALPKRLRGDKEWQNIMEPETINTTELTNPADIPILNSAQQEAITAINNAHNKFTTFLLAGITGSGKTEVYLQIAAYVISKQQQVIIIVPEISLTPQLIQRVQARFNLKIAILHSKLTEKTRYENWQLACSGAAKIIVGTRSAALIPFANPGIFIIDEEHDTSFKQQTGLRYSARDLLVRRGHLEQCPVVLGSATPALETIHNVNNNKYIQLTLPTRAGIAQPPKITIVDSRQPKLPGGLSNKLLNKIKQHLAEKNQVLLFLNRRGYAPVLMCFQCGSTVDCKQCDVKLTVHQSHNKLQCHHCGSSCAIPKQCAQCNTVASVLQPIGIGTEKVAEVLAEYFPDANIDRIDKDTTTKKDALKIAVAKVKDGTTNILLGTQMIAKGHDFPNVTLAAIVDIDGSWFSNDFRSIEKMAQLIIQVAGRAGRAQKLGEVILQTKQPHNPLLKLLLSSGYMQFAKILLQERQQLHLPPFSYHASINAKSKKKTQALQLLSDLKRACVAEVQQQNTLILGPVAAVIEKRADYYYAQLLLQANNRSSLHSSVRQLLLFLESAQTPAAVKWTLDIDPVI